jgi:microcystin-dependent protein
MGVNSGFFMWSTTPASNGNADTTVNFLEGQAPSTLNDSNRASMARLREWGNDIAGAIVTSGTSTGYTVSSNQGFDTLAHLNGQVIAFTPHATNGATVTLNVDSLGAKPLRTAPNAELLAGVLIQGTPYLATYNNTDGAFYLQGFYGNPYNIPVGASIDFWGSTTPNSSFVLPYGQAISRTVYSYLFNNVFGTAYGAGDGSTTFNIPDLRGRVIASPDTMGGGDAGRLSGSVIPNRGLIGSAGGEAKHALAASEIPTITSSVSVNVSGSISGSTSGVYVSGTGSGVGGGGSFGIIGNASVSGSFSGSGSGSATSNNTGGAAHNVMQPTILANRILRII